MGRLAAAIVMGFLLSACAVPVEPTREAPGPAKAPPAPCANRDREWNYQRSEILRLNKGYAYFEIIRRAAFVEQFNALPPKTDRPAPQVAGYFAKPDEKTAIMAFASGGCVTYLEVVDFDNIQAILRQLTRQ
ncbi:MAG: hypothetical protein ACTSQV_00715 [Alphaproteobacteria bacterium]